MEKIAFCGAGGTGKTTLLEELQAVYGNDKGATYANEAARQYFAENPVPDHKRRVKDTQHAILDLIMSTEATLAQTNPRVMFCDRSLMDPIVYSTFGGHLNDAHELYARVEPHLPAYTKFYILDPADIPHVMDDIRIEDADFRQRLHESFMQVFDDRGVEFELLSGTLTERLAIVQQSVGNLAVET